MKFLQLILVTTPVALASPLSGTGIPRDTSGTQQVNIDLQVNKVTSESTIEVWNEDHTQLLTQSCSKSLALKTGRTSKSPIAFDVDQDGFGTLTFGDKTYTISGNPEVSGGIDCGSIVSDTETLISCIVPGVSPDVLRLNTISLAQKSKLPSCFPDGGPLEVAEVARAAQEGRRVISLAETMRTWQQLDLEEAGAAGIGGNETVADTDDKEALSERQYNPCSQWTPTTIREGDGDPHQTAKHIQVTVSLVHVSNLYLVYPILNRADAEPGLGIETHGLHKRRVQHRPCASQVTDGPVHGGGQGIAVDQRRVPRREVDDDWRDQHLPRGARLGGGVDEGGQDVVPGAQRPVQCVHRHQAARPRLHHHVAQQQQPRRQPLLCPREAVRSECG